MTPYAVNHVVPSYGYIVSGQRHAASSSPGDTGPTERLWTGARRARNVKAVFLECSFSDREERLAADSLHLTPRLVRAELPEAAAARARASVPRQAVFARPHPA